MRGPTKSTAGERRIPLPIDLANALGAHIATRGAIGPDDYVFIDSNAGRPIEPRRLHDWWKAALERAGLDTAIVFHDSRRSAASWMISSGANPKVVQALLGHADVAVTLELYARSLDSDERDAIGRIEQLLSQSSDATGNNEEAGGGVKTTT